METLKRNLQDPDAVGLLQTLRQGKLSSEQLVRQHLARLGQAQPFTNAATAVFQEQALAEARQLDASGERGLPLFGLPFSAKETFGLAGQQVTAGSLRMTPEVHTEDAEIVRRLRTAGAVLIARSNVPEFAMTAESSNPRFGRTNNPLDLRRVAGGSTGGEGALVGSGASVFGVGSDILGSIRIPAAFCGIVGFKPHSTAVDLRGTWPTVTGHTRPWLALGPLTRSVRDAELVYNVIANTPVPVTPQVHGRLINPRGFPLKLQQACIGEALAAARKALVHQFTQEEQDFSDTRSLFLQIPKLILADFAKDWQRLLSSPEAGEFSTLKELFAQLRGKPTIDSGLLRWLLIAPLLKPRSAARVQELAARFMRARTHYHGLLGEDGVLVLPTLGLLAPPHGKMNAESLKPGVNGLFTAHTMGNYLDLPAIAIPAWKYCDPQTGLPPSISVLCAPGGEARLFAAAKLIEVALS